MTKRLTFISTVAFTLLALVVLGAYSTTPSAGATSITSLENLQAGDLVRGETFSAVYYYGMDGFRYVFPNDKTYFTWYDNFDNVKWVKDSDLSKIQIGGNVTYRPGVKMVKIQSDKKVYAVAAGGKLKAITSEQVAKDLYGSTWNKMIDDVPDGFFSNYTLSGNLDVASSFSVTAEKNAAFSIDVDKKLKAPIVVNFTDGGYSPVTTTLDAGRAVKFMNGASDKHTATADNKKWGTGTLNPGGSFSRYFDEPGTYKFHDAYDDWAGTLIVE